MRFRKVKIVRGQEVVEYSENLCSGWTKYRDSNKLWCYEKKGIDWEKCDNHKYVEKYRRSTEKYHRSLKKPGKRLNLENTSWFVIDADSGEKITRCDSIEQAKRFCIKNSYDFGMF